MFAVATMGLVFCGGGSGKSLSQISVSLDVLDDYFDVKSCKLETNVAEISVRTIDPYNKFNSDEENQKNRQAHYDAFTGVPTKTALPFLFYKNAFISLRTSIFVVS